MMTYTKRFQLVAFASCLTAVVSCHDSPTDLLAPESASKTIASSADLKQTINDLIQQIFPGGQRTAAAARWRNITDKLDAGQTKPGQKMLAELVKWVQGKKSELIPPSGETKEHVAARLILDMSIYTYRDPSQPLPPVPTVGTDAIVAVLDPTAPATVITPEHKAGIAIPQGAVSEPTVLVVYEDASQARTLCSGPLDTELCQYPRFYHFDPFPHQRLNQPARIGVCHITSGPNAPARDSLHDGRLRVAHDAPTDPADYTPNATHTDGIEILPLANIADFLLCGNTTVASASVTSHTGNTIADRSWRVLNMLASAAAWVVVPKAAYAIDQGGGGTTLDFSNFAVVDPVPRWSRYCPANPHRSGTYADLDSAIAHAPESNIVLVCDGNWPTNEATVNRPVTIRSEHSGGATLSQPSTAAASDAVLRVSGVAAGNVHIADLKIQFTGFGIRAMGDYDQLTVDSVTFTGAGATDTTSANTGLQLEASNVTTAHVTLIRSSFTQSYFGAVEKHPVAFDTYNSTFSNIGRGGVVYYSTPGAFSPNYVPSSVMQPGIIDGNTFTNVGISGRGGAIMIEQPGDIAVTNNHITMNAPYTTAVGIFVYRGGIVAANTRPTRIRGNIIVGHASTGEPSNFTTWGFWAGIRLSQGVAGIVDTLTNNSVSGSFSNLDMLNSVRAVATDNTLSNSYVGIRLAAPIVGLEVNRNDVSGYTIPLIGQGSNGFNGTPALANGSFACNWWGNVSGPQGINPNLNPGSYLPYSTQPIANTSFACISTSAAPSLVRVCATASGTGVPTVPTLGQAMQYVAAGGTVKICDGTYTVFNVNLNAKSMTIEGEGPGIPTLDAGGNGNIFTMGSQTPMSTAIVLRKLRLQNAGFNDVNVGGKYGSVLMDQIEFHPTHGVVQPGNTLAYSDGVGVFSATGGGVTVQNSTFDGGDIGVHMNGADNVTVISNTFTNHLNAAIHGGGGGNLRATGNTISNCGPNWCIGIFNAPGQSGLFKLMNNTLNIDFSHRAENAIQAHHASYEISGNVITGTGGSRLSSDRFTWPMNNAIVVSDTATATINGNRVTGAYTGIGFNNGTLGTGSDNVINTVNFGINFGAAGAMSISRSDFTNYATSIAGFNAPTALARCNWWGSSDGPSNAPASNSTIYTPWAYAPIANSGTSCDPNAAAPSIVRVCSTQGSSQYPTVGTIQSAMSLVAAGGSIEICDGTYTVFNVSLNAKSMTIEGEGPGVPTLDAQGNYQVFTMDSQTPINTSVTLRKLMLVNAAQGDVTVRHQYGSLLIDQVAFRPIHGVVNNTQVNLAYSTGLDVQDAIGPGVTVQNSDFSGGDIGVQERNASVTITNNTFRDLLNAAIHGSEGGSITATRNTVTNCGTNWCIGVFNSANVGTYNFYNNSITTDDAHQVGNAFQLGSGSYVLDGNVISGIGGTRDPNNGATWPIQYNGIAVYGSVQIVRNVIAGAYNGLMAGGATGTATDNTVHDIGSPINLDNYSQVTNVGAHRNDFYNFAKPFATNFSVSSATCNWWGVSSGPGNFTSGVDPSLYTPWATSPIAKQPGVSCP